MQITFYIKMHVGALRGNSDVPGSPYDFLVTTRQAKRKETGDTEGLCTTDISSC
jgi:hypothetical protein